MRIQCIVALSLLLYELLHGWRPNNELSKRNQLLMQVIKAHQGFSKLTRLRTSGFKICLTFHDFYCNKKHLRHPQQA